MLRLAPARRPLSSSHVLSQDWPDCPRRQLRSAIMVINGSG